ncbi:MAG: DUF3185 family protein [Candidatus Cyclonatronum sp.]|uniref:DUF3185 family protein n=1 Tax=Cyclonatronum sp. TaxID=3024185 RepID=UPI0025C48B02|nr:DUF3185 family protein [Cyclonatronum sp.]MCC5935314.1 DUF3185 family protein [Balneolales bacterium]MCH8487416.1 DUF3185 family protein [Cyclonatronum sp.]
MKQIFGAALLLGGLVLLYFGWGEYNSFASDVSEAFTGSPTDNAVWYLTGGAIASLAGVLLLIGGRKNRS